MKIKSLLYTLSIFALLFSSLVNAQVSLPSGFNLVLVSPGITAPTTMTTAPDGRFFIAQQNGQLRVMKNDTLLVKPFITLNVNTNGERGLLGVAVDPSFPTNPYIYLCYTVADGTFNRVSRFTASGDTVVPGSEVIIMDLDTLIANYHGGGHIDFGPDGTLYIATGENGRPWMSPKLNSYLGKILRINADGSVPTGNPFTGPGKQQRIWSYGLRNPFTFSFQPQTGRLFVNDVGEITYEEINDNTVGGGNYGWPAAEGNSTDTSYENPVFTYIHGVGADSGCAITGGDFFNPDSTSYPSSYDNNYFYIDYCSDWINYINVSGTPAWTNFATNIPKYSVGIMTGPDGNLYFLSRNNEALYKITYSTVAPPSMLTNPQSQTISLGFPVTFSAYASGAPVLSYQWRKGTVDISGATGTSYTIPSVIYSNAGNYNVVVTNSFGTTTSANAYLTVVSNQPPTAIIDTPLSGAMYTAGETIYFHGDATDPEEGTLPDSVFEWSVIFHHDAHIHPGPTAGTGMRSGSFVIPNVGEVSANVFYRIYLVVRDSAGAIDSTWTDIHPRTSTFIVNSQPPGLSLTLDGQPVITPDTVLGVAGMLRQIGAPYSQPNNLLFTHWNNGGTSTQLVTTPLSDTVWTAFYDSVQWSYKLSNDTIICIGDSIELDAGVYFSYAWTDGSVGRYLSLLSSVPDTFVVGVTVTNSSGAGNDSITIIFDVCSNVSMINTQDIGIFPNPSRGDVIIEGLLEDYLLNVVDMTGRYVIFNESVKANNAKTVHLSPGIYSFVLYSKDRIIGYKKVVITE